MEGLRDDSENPCCSQRRQGRQSNPPYASVYWNKPMQ